MIHDGASHRVFRISELTRLIASQLILISPGGAVNLACACQYLEEPVLSPLWQTQSSLDTLLKVLPKETWSCENPGPDRSALAITRDPSPEAWSRVQRYASWMRNVYMGDIVDDTFRKLRLNSPAGGLFPALQRFNWGITESNIPYADLFFSPYLKEVIISPSRPWISSGVPHHIVPAIASTISALPVTTLQSLHLPYAVHWADLEESLSSVALRCGPSLTEFVSPIPLSGAAINHLIHLPHLNVWRLEGSPPSYSNLPLPTTFPPLIELALGRGVKHGWLSLFKRLKGDVSSKQGVIPSSRVRESLNYLELRDSPGLAIDISFTSTILIFRNLTCLIVQIDCHDEDDVDRCPFKLNDDDVTRFAMAMPQMECLYLGYPCSKNTCATTVACLLPISVYCVGLQEMEIHFNTTNIVNDLKNISRDPRFQTLRSLPRCSLDYLGVSRMPLAVDSPNFEALVNGMVDIFPSLRNLSSPTVTAVYGSDWEGFYERITERWKM